MYIFILRPFLCQKNLSINFVHLEIDSIESLSFKVHNAHSILSGVPLTENGRCGRDGNVTYDVITNSQYYNCPKTIAYLDDTYLLPVGKKYI